MSTLVADPRELPALLRLLDDDSPVVRNAVTERLAAFGPELGAELAALDRTPDPGARDLLREVLSGPRRVWLREVWPSWFHLAGDAARIEAALSLLAEFLGGFLHRRRLGSLLDELAEVFRASDRSLDPKGLARFLFTDRGLEGDDENYYHPDRSDLVDVIEGGRGIPISLTLIYVLVGRRLGLDIQSCNFPGHFLARVRQDGEIRFVDCFHEGRFLSEADFLRADPQYPEALHEVLHEGVSSETVIARVLNNLTRAFHDEGAVENRELMRELARPLREGGPALRQGPRLLP